MLRHVFTAVEMRNNGMQCKVFPIILTSSVPKAATEGFDLIILLAILWMSMGVT